MGYRLLPNVAEWLRAEAKKSEATIGTVTVRAVIAHHVAVVANRPAAVVHQGGFVTPTESRRRAGQVRELVGMTIEHANAEAIAETATAAGISHSDLVERCLLAEMNGHKPS